MMRRAALLLLAACSPQSAPPPGGAAPASDSGAVVSAPTPVVSLERTPCFGTCPVYQVTITRAGAVHFVGKRHVARQGEANGEVSRTRVDELLNELEARGYFGFANDYVMNAPACGLYATDSPMAITSVTLDGRTKTIRHDHGCSSAPDELGRLEGLIDDVAGSSQWIGH